MDEKEKRIKNIVNFYYSNRAIAEAIVKFGKDREVVPRYFEGFGKRPDIIDYPSDIFNLAKKGATSFHGSEEIWRNPLEISSDLSRVEINELRKSWDLLIDIDSPFLDCSKIAAKLIIEALENHGVKNYGIKFSGSKGFHIIVSGVAFPEELNGSQMKNSFPEWPRAISGYLMNYIKSDYDREVGKIVSVNEILKRTKLKQEDIEQTVCKECGRTAKRGAIVKYKCDACGFEIERKDVKVTKRKLKCSFDYCGGNLKVIENKEYSYCEFCEDPEKKGVQLNSEKYSESFERVKGVNAEKIAALDLVLVAPRHLFRMPYSLHEKTALASVVIEKEEIGKFEPRMADPMNIKIKDFLPKNENGEATKLLLESLDWEKRNKKYNEEFNDKKYNNIKFDEKFEGVNEGMFPRPIKKLLKGLSDGKKRGLFVLITFLRYLNYSPEDVNKKIREWNEKNSPPLKEGYLRSQLDWHFRQRKKIMPPNYDRESFYRDLDLIEKKPVAKNPISEIRWKLRKEWNQ